MKYLLLFVSCIVFGQVSTGCFSHSDKQFQIDATQKAIYLVKIVQSKNKSSLLDREEMELKRNFSGIPVKYISEYGIYKYKNQTFYFSEMCEDYKSFLFCTGNSKDSIFENKKIVLSSEFFSKKFRTEEKKSSYVSDFEKEKKDFLNKLHFIPDEKSKILSNLFLDLTVNRKMLGNLLLPPFKFIKKGKIKRVEILLTSYLPKGNIFTSPFSFMQPQIGNVNFNESGNIDKIETKDESLKDITLYNLSYENELVKKISTQFLSTTIFAGGTAKSEWKTQNKNIYYDDETLIVDEGKDEYDGGKAVYNLFKINENWKDKIINDTYLIDEKNYNIAFSKNLDGNCLSDNKTFFFKICYEDVSLTIFPSQIKLSDYDFKVNKDVKNSTFEIEYITPSKNKIVQKYTYDKNENLKNISLFYDDKIIKKWDLNYSFYK